MNKSQLIKAFLNAVNTWKAYVKARIAANKLNDKTSKSLLGKAVFYWIKQAEALKAQLDVMVKASRCAKVSLAKPKVDLFKYSKREDKAQISFSYTLNAGKMASVQSI